MKRVWRGVQQKCAMAWPLLTEHCSAGGRGRGGRYRAAALAGRLWRQVSIRIWPSRCADGGHCAAAAAAVAAASCFHSVQRALFFHCAAASCTAGRRSCAAATARLLSRALGGRRGSCPRPGRRGRRRRQLQLGCPSGRRPADSLHNCTELVAAASKTEDSRDERSTTWGDSGSSGDSRAANAAMGGTRFMTTASATEGSLRPAHSPACFPISVTSHKIRILAKNTSVRRGRSDPPQRSNVAVVRAVGRAPVGTGAGGVPRPAPGDVRRCRAAGRRYRAAGCHPSLVARRREWLRRLDLHHHRTGQHVSGGFSAN
jgi:hypothetical protein